MKLSQICIERPVFATVLNLLLIVVGYMGFTHLETRYFPKVHEPFARVDVSYPGGSPTLMEHEVTRILENTLIYVDGLADMHSSSRYGRSTIYLRFADDGNFVKEMGQVRDRVSSVRGQLPDDIRPPSISSGGVARPVLNIGFIDETKTAAEIRNYVIQHIEPSLLKIHGMGAVWLFGASTYALRIWLDPQKMAAYGVTVKDIKDVLTHNNISFSGGQIQGKERRYSIVADTRLRSVDQFSNLIVRDTEGQIIRMKDVANVELGSRSLYDSPMRINGKSAIDMELRPLDTANPIDVAEASKVELKKIKESLPPNMKMLITYDQSTFLKDAINESYHTLIEAVILVMLVVYLFLGSLRAALVPIITIPVCIVGAFGLMLMFGFSINVMTLLAMILAIGLVVDDAIVVLENIHRHIELGLNPLEAAVKGSKEIGFSIIAMTLTLAAVYAPIGFVSGFTSAVFREFAFTLAGSVLISGFVALTLSPMMCARILKPKEKESWIEKALTKGFDVLNAGYRQQLLKIFNYKKWLILVLLGIAVLGYIVYLFVPQAFIPKEDIGYFTASISSPPNSTVSYTNRYMTDLEKIYGKTPEVLSYASFINAGGATNFVTMQPWDKRNLSTTAVMKQLNQEMKNIPGVDVRLSMPDPINYSADSGGSAIQIHVLSLDGYETLKTKMDELVKILQKYPGLSNVRSNLKFNNQVVETTFKRAQAASLDVNLQDVADTMSILLGGKHITDIQKGSQTFDVLVQMQMEDLSSFASLNKIYVRSANKSMVPLSNLVEYKKSIRQATLNRQNRIPAATISAEMSPGYSLNEVMLHINGVMKSNLTDNEQFKYGGRIKAFLSSSGTMLGLFALSIIFIYLVLSAQFESFIDPFIILLTVPLCIVGAIMTLKLIGGSMNLYTNIGLITLVGLITKHGILITQFANTELQKGKPLIESVINAAVTRLRPIMMTTSAMVLGAIPLALASGPGSVSHSQIGWVIVGGMLFGTFFSLLVVPVAYILLAQLDQKKQALLA